MIFGEKFPKLPKPATVLILAGFASSGFQFYAVLRFTIFGVKSSKFYVLRQKLQKFHEKLQKARNLHEICEKFNKVPSLRFTKVQPFFSPTFSLRIHFWRTLAVVGVTLGYFGELC
jgi:hypothetical protein